ncbi:ADM protein [Liparis tanakae]|uniref:Pro-adrenomedullin n=1 Tax=Liparis tanakae TaxID=230148 RepID=A0A4Z2IHC7_9TELE|nr:ADM protein [Liparis tanakae]
MGLALHAVICCCVLTAVLPLVSGAANSTSPKNGFKVWRESRVKRDLCNGSAAAEERRPDVDVAPRQDEDPKGVSPTSPPPPPPCFGLHVRSRRSTSGKASGCKFVTCVYHDLLHRLHQINEMKSCAPGKKISSRGYGRRRRRRRSLLQILSERPGK